ncbi:MAG: hypothetical protein B5M53_08620 [Candidatus Cloacimonas sp. 4484_209]|nr:MAG: hypothetical protein B5M53_08620 [Candidatus Cloacimonas sp. 4484_209]
MNKALLGLGIIGLLGVGYLLTSGHPKEKIIPSGSAIQGIPQIVTIGAGASKKESIPIEKSVVYNVKVEAPEFKDTKPFSLPTKTDTSVCEGGVFTSIPTSAIKPKKSKYEEITGQEIKFLPALSKETFSQYQESLYSYYTPKKPGVVWTPVGGVSTAFPSAYGW